MKSSYRTILRSSSIIGAASVLSILSGIVRMKAVALLLGPAGVGLVGLYQNVIRTAATLSALGLGSVGTRQIAAAEAEGGGPAVGRARRALFWGTLGLSLIGAVVFFAASGWIATYVIHDPSRRGEVAWLTLGVVLTVASGSQGALLTGMRRIGDVARVQFYSAILSTVIGIFAIWWLGAAGLLAMILAAPVVTFLAGHWYVARLGPPEGARPALRELMAEWRVMASIGFAFMLSVFITQLGHLAARALVQRELGPDALGQFQAAWAIGTTYLGFVLGAMGTDYYPRLSAIINDPVAAGRVVNEQTEVALILAAPVLLAMLALTPWVIHLLYSAEFTPAVEVLRWQLLGDILKVMSWPLGFILLAAGAGKTLIVTETTATAVFVAVIALAMPLIGVSATGVASLVLYLCYLPLILVLGRRRIGFRWSREVIRQAVALILAAVLVFGLSYLSEPLAATVGLVLAAAFALVGLATLGQKADLGGRVGRLAAMIRKVTDKVGLRK